VLSPLVGNVLMKEVRFIYSSIMLASKRGKRVILINCSSKNLMYLNLFVTLNIIAYYTINSTCFTHRVIIKHHGGLPVLKSVLFIGDDFNGNVSKVQ